MVTTARQCNATTQHGTACQTPASDSGYCFHHDPARAAERAAARAKGGRARHGRQVSTAQHDPVQVQTADDIMRLLEAAINDALRLENSLNRARTVGYLAMAAVKVLETRELAERVAALEASIANRH